MTLKVSNSRKQFWKLEVKVVLKFDVQIHKMSTKIEGRTEWSRIFRPNSETVLEFGMNIERPTASTKQEKVLDVCSQRETTKSICMRSFSYKS